MYTGKLKQVLHKYLGVTIQNIKKFHTRIFICHFPKLSFRVYNMLPKISWKQYFVLSIIIIIYIQICYLYLKKITWVGNKILV